uniref:Glutathione S-transferase n=1 Tax=Panagrolaimus sp. JU765 TaxID=591449 RepID=A0AC34Q6R0_9BILA
MTNYKLEYFPARFRVEAARLILHFAGQKFDDVKISREDWPKRKPTTPFGSIPVLTVNGVQLSQSLPICQFLARRFNLAGKDELEIAKVNAVADFQNDLLNVTVPYIVALLSQSADFPEKKAELAENVKKYWPKLVQALRASKSRFFADSGLTWVDFFVAEYTDSIAKTFPVLVSQFPDLIQHSSRVHALPQLQDYLKTRPEMPW